MDTLYTALLILILIGIAGLGWFSFVLYKKQRRNSEKVIREVYKASNEIKEYFPLVLSKRSIRTTNPAS